MQRVVVGGDDLGVHPQAGDRAQVFAVPDEIADSAFPGGEFRGHRAQRAFPHGAAVLEIAAARGEHRAAGDGHELPGPAVLFGHGQFAGQHPQRHVGRDRSRRRGGRDRAGQPVS